MTSREKGRFIWYDLVTTDPEAAQEFYPQITGWTLQEWEGPDAYTLFRVGDTPVGGVMALPEEAVEAGAPPHWFAHVASPDVEATTVRARELGATVLVEPEPVPGVGRFSILRDPQGAVFAAFTFEGEPVEYPDQPRVGDFSWHELATTDHEAALAFYRELFDWEVGEAMDMGDGWIYQLFRVGGRDVGGVFDKPPEMEGPPAWVLYVRVADLDDALERVREHGGRVVNGPQEVPGGDRVAQCMDPDGAVFALHEKAGSAPAS